MENGRVKMKMKKMNFVTNIPEKVIFAYMIPLQWCSLNFGQGDFSDTHNINFQDYWVSENIFGCQGGKILHGKVLQYTTYIEYNRMGIR